MQTNKGTAGPARTIDNYLRPGVKAVGMSAYAEKKVSDGHEVATTSPVTMPETIGAWSSKVGLPVSVITGWAVDHGLPQRPRDAGQPGRSGPRPRRPTSNRRASRT